LEGAGQDQGAVRYVKFDRLSGLLRYARNLFISAKPMTVIARRCIERSRNERSDEAIQKVKRWVSLYSGLTIFSPLRIALYCGTIISIPSRLKMSSTFLLMFEDIAAYRSGLRV